MYGNCLVLFALEKQIASSISLDPKTSSPHVLETKIFNDTCHDPIELCQTCFKKLFKHKNGASLDTLWKGRVLRVDHVKEVYHKDLTSRLGDKLCVLPVCYSAKHIRSIKIILFNKDPVNFHLIRVSIQDIKAKCLSIIHDKLFWVLVAKTSTNHVTASFTSTEKADKW